MMNFNEGDSRKDSLRLEKLGEYFREYAAGGLLGEELEPSSLHLGRSVQPTIASIQDIDEIVVEEAEHLGDGVFEVRCVVGLFMELDLNDEEDNSAIREATMDITLEVDVRGRKITGHHINMAYAPDDC